ncbi:MAG: F0F1 ATP synthase subunit alpha, partial [Lachnospiraceae bacterium]|nr:F0F1 ATP synthase subunit alpha [Lachnospiraceae bacterium]
LESNLFFSGQRPAVNVGLSVSRVGGDAQTKAVKKATGSMKLDLEQYREMEVFTQFSSDLDDTTKRQLTYGAGLMRLLRQPQYHPLSQHQQVTILTAALNRVMQDVPLDSMGEFKDGLIRYVEIHAKEACDEIEAKGQLNQFITDAILKASRDYLDVFMREKARAEA